MYKGWVTKTSPCTATFVNLLVTGHSSGARENTVLSAQLKEVIYLVFKAQ
jgi:hypothetical protein